MIRPTKESTEHVQKVIVPTRSENFQIQGYETKFKELMLGLRKRLFIKKIY